MNTKSIKKLVLALVMTVGSFMTLPAYAWPDVDHMNMCGTPAKVVRTFGGNFQGWAAHDRYLAQRGKGYYFRTMCPETVASKPKKKIYKKRVVKKAKRKVVRRTAPKVRKVKRISKRAYNEKLDCKLVDQMNGSNQSAVRVIRRR